MKNFFFIFSFCFLFSCSNEPENNSSLASTTENERVTSQPGLNLSGTDSIELYFYKDPGKKKEYTKLMVRDVSAITAFVNNLEKETMQRNECPHDSKVFLFRNGEVYKTIYVATSDTCRYLAYAVHARQYFVPLDDSVSQLLVQWQQRAR